MDGGGYPVLFYTTLRFNETPLLASSLYAGVRGNQGVKEHTDHKPRNALPGGNSLVGNNNNKLEPRSPNDTRLCERAQCDLVEVGITLYFLSF